MFPTNHNPGHIVPTSPQTTPPQQHGVTSVTGLRLLNLTTPHRSDQKPVEYGYGKCSRCSCPGFVGSGYTCTRGGCGHHYDEHW